MSKQLDKTRPTLKTISELSGLAVPTVSRALSDAPDISASTKRQVREIAKKIGYRANRAGLRLRTGKTQVIAIVLLTSHEVMSQTAMLIESIAGGLRSSDYQVNILPYFPHEDPMTTVQNVVETGSADGIIFNGITPADPRVEYLRQQNFPFACHGRSQKNNDYPWFDFDHFAFAFLGMQQFANRGRKNVALVAPPVDQSYGLEFKQGALQAAGMLNVDVKIIAAADSTFSIEATHDALSEHWQSHPETDGFLCGSSTSALVLIGLANDKNLIIGKDFDIVTRESMPIFAHLDEGIISVLEDIRAAGKILAQGIVQLINNPSEAPMQFLERPGFDTASKVDVQVVTPG